MADKMMRVSARSKDGYPKAIKSNVEGNLQVELYKGGAVTNYYKNGKEYTSFEQGIMRPESDTIKAKVSKESGFLRLYTNDSTNYAYANFISAFKIDVTDIETLVIDWENLGDDLPRNESTFGLTGAKTNTSFQKSIKFTKKFSRMKSSLDVSDMTGEYYIRIQSMNSGVPDNILTDLRVYSISKEDGSEIKTTDETLNKSIERIEKNPVALSKRNVIMQQKTIEPSTSFILVDDFEFNENVSSWSLYALEGNRPPLQLLDSLVITLEFTDIKGEYYDENSSTLFQSGLVFRGIIELSDVDEDGKGLITSIGEERGGNLILEGNHFNKPLARYMRITLESTLSGSQMKLLNPTIFLEGNF